MSKKYYKKRAKNEFIELITKLIVFGAFGYLIYNGWQVDEKFLLLVCVTVAAICIFIIIIKYLMLKHKKAQYLKSNLYQIDTMSGRQFEEFLKAHFEEKGYTVKLTPKSGDYGVDLICERKYINDKLQSKDKLVIQAKRYKGKIGIAAVQQIIGGMHYYESNSGMVITNSYFTNNAWELAKKSNVILWDRKKLQQEFDIKN